VNVSAATSWPQGGRHLSRPAFTLLELTIVLMISGVIGAAIGMTLLHQQRFYRGASDLLYAREGVRDALEVLSTDIRGSSSADSFRLMADSAIELFSNIGSSVVCRRLTDLEVGLPAATARGNTFTALLTQPDTGDLVLFYRDSLEADSRWERHRIAAFGHRSLDASCPAGGPFSPEASDGGPGFVLTLATPLSPHVAPGAPVRFIRRGRFSLYRSSNDEWYLGYRRCNAVGPSTCGPVQPVSGPYAGYSSDPGATGLLFEYVDARGEPVEASSPIDVARVDITARAVSPGNPTDGGARQGGDSGKVSLAIRNRLH